MQMEVCVYVCAIRRVLLPQEDTCAIVSTRALCSQSVPDCLARRIKISTDIYCKR